MTLMLKEGFPSINKYSEKENELAQVFLKIYVKEIGQGEGAFLFCFQILPVCKDHTFTYDNFTCCLLPLSLSSNLKPKG